MWSESQMYEVYSSVGSGVDILKKKNFKFDLAQLWMIELWIVEINWDVKRVSFQGHNKLKMWMLQLIIVVDVQLIITNGI